ARLAARIADGPGKAQQGPPNNAGREEEAKPSFVRRHRISLSADDSHREALVLVSIVTEGERWEDEENNFRGEKGEKLRRRCLEKVEAAAGLGFEELRRRHARDVEALFGRVEFSLGSSSEGGEERKGAGEGVTPRPSSSSCVAGLPIRTRVSRSGKACTERGEEASDADNFGDDGEALATSEDTESIVVDDGLIELMYHFGRYLMISGSRPGGQPLNLQGIWANSLEAKWQGDYHMNINLQMAYWGAHAAGLPECAEPLVPFVEALSEGGQQTAQRREEYYVMLDRAVSWVAHANTDRWGGTAAHGDAVWALCPTCGAWMALHLWEAYEYTR
ncbi:unnamed protein product, partial [Laminaria digitata]